MRTSEITAWLKTFLEFQEDSQGRQDKARETAQQQQLLAHQQQIHAQQQQMQILQELITIQTNDISANQQSTSIQINSRRNDKTASTPRPTTLQEDTNYSNFISWRKTWQDYVMLIKLENMDVDIERAHLRSCISEDTRTYIKCALGIFKETTLSLKEILDNKERHHSHECSAKSSQCRNCNRTGHRDTACRTPKNKQKVKLTVLDDDEGCIHNVSINQINLKTPKVMTEYIFKNQSCSLSSIADTGTEVTVDGEI